MKKIAIYPGTFDPITNGHLDLVERALRIFDEVIIAVAQSQRKQPLFSVKERLNLIRLAVKRFERARVETFNGLLVEYVGKKKGVAILRGLRAVSDFEYELQMAHMNRRLNTNIETVFMMPSEDYSFLTSTIVKEIASLGGDVKDFVPVEVEKALIEKFKIVGDIVE
ncbi:MAG: pantetheine-phosphate adenylyltransferase [Thermodesulfovibrio sp. RBG_19FT_COMBO_42_12]|nr:MAG: pantetheine-phosphate adenylyltransferase [Thermodesulfovibrio sp. RBG_19FT_COMBO_42_12]